MNALELIAKYGRKVKLLTLEQDEVSTDTPWRTDAPSVATSVEVDAAFVPASGASLSLVNQDLLARCEMVCLVAPMEGKSLERAHQLEDGVGQNATLWKVNWVQVLQPGNTVELYTYGVSR